MCTGAKTAQAVKSIITYLYVLNNKILLNVLSDNYYIITY